MEQLTQLPWYFYAFFALLVIYSWVAGFAYIYREKGKKGIIKASILFLINIAIALAIYRHFATKKARATTHHNTTISSTFLNQRYKQGNQPDRWKTGLHDAVGVVNLSSSARIGVLVINLLFGYLSRITACDDQYPPLRLCWPSFVYSLIRLSPRLNSLT